MHMSVKEVETLFGTTMYEYAHRRSARRILRAGRRLNIPESIENVLTFVNLNAHPLGVAVAKYGSQRRSLSAFEGVTPEVLRRLYKIPDDRVATNETNLQCVPEFFDENWSRGDLDAFYSTNNLSIPPRVVQKGTRANDDTKPSSEASLDLQYISGMAPNATTIVWNMNGTNPFSSIDEPFFEWGQQILDEDHPPFVISISYSDDEQHIFQSSEAYARSFDNLLMKMGTRGISVLMSSGDDGVAGQRPDVSKLGANERCLHNGPQWPTGSPFITAVGATMLLPQDGTDQFFWTPNEVACSGSHGGMITVGGGFANQYGIPPVFRDRAELH